MSRRARLSGQPMMSLVSVRLMRFRAESPYKANGAKTQMRLLDTTHTLSLYVWLPRVADGQ